MPHSETPLPFILPSPFFNCKDIDKPCQILRQMRDGPAYLASELYRNDTMAWIWLYFVLALSNAHSEYRVFDLLIENPSTQSSRHHISTLDPDQYPGYYPVNSGERVTYVQTWKCKGNTSEFRAICPPSSSAGPASPSNPPQ